ncbi:MAG: polysaccharide biosynthesis/export family protein [Chlamydiia bacterium]|nr:polysaccharide biosynthesis/export family protein [Chlamydiia bacterium]
MVRYILFSLTLLVGCQPPCRHATHGADDFVIDSYCIQKGKLAILEMQGIDYQEIRDVDLLEYHDSIAEGDRLHIAVYHPTRKDLIDSIQYINEKMGGFRVQGGKVDLPDLPAVEVEGLTLDEAKERIRKELQKEIQHIDLYLTYQERPQEKVTLSGMVQTDSIPVDGKIRLYEVLSRAKIPPDANLFMSYVLRNRRPLGVDLHQLINQGDMSQNIVMRGGDKIFIAAATDAQVMLMGEIARPQAIPVKYGSISLKEALVSAGGIPFTGNRNRIQVIRGSVACPKVYCLCWEHIIHLPNESLLLMPGDAVYITEKPITQWNRFIDQLLPSCHGFETVYGIYRLTKD